MIHGHHVSELRPFTRGFSPHHASTTSTGQSLTSITEGVTVSPLRQTKTFDMEDKSTEERVL